MPHDKIKIYLETWRQEQIADTSINYEYQIAEEIMKILENLKKSEGYEPTEEDIAERWAFYFLANCCNRLIGWETYYQPIIISSNGEPNIKEVVCEETLKYWTKRAKESRDPILSSRYADLVVDFSPKILKKSADIKLFLIVINSNITICEESLMPYQCRKTKAKRALDLATYKHDSQRTARTKNIIINLAEEEGDWDLAFKSLLLDFDNIPLSDKEKENLIKKTEEQLENLPPRLIDYTVSLLAEYYAKEKDEKSLMRVLAIFENSLKSEMRLNSDAFITTNRYERIRQRYMEYANKFDKAKTENERVIQEIEQLDLDWGKSRKSIEIGFKGIDEYTNSFFDKDSKLETTMEEIAIRCLPKKDDMKEKSDAISSKYPISFLTSEKIILSEGVLTATLPPLMEGDKDSNLRRYAQQYILLSSLLLSPIMEKLKKQFSKTTMVTYFKKSVLFESEYKIIDKAISAYWENNYLCSSHIFIPLIERVIRNFKILGKSVLKSKGKSVLKPNRASGYDYLSLNALLAGSDDNKELFEKFFSSCGNDLSFYLRFVLLEKQINLRNDFAHGINPEKFFEPWVSDILFYILIWLSLVPKKKNEIDL